MAAGRTVTVLPAKRNRLLEPKRAWWNTGAVNWVYRIGVWYFAYAGAKAVVSLNLFYGAPVKAVAAAFLLAGALSMFQPRQAALWAGVAGGAAVLGEGIRAYVYPAFAMAMPGRFALLLVLALAIGAAGAAAGSVMPGRTTYFDG